MGIPWCPDKQATVSLMGVWFQSFHYSLMFLNVHNLTNEADFQLLNQGELNVIGNLSLAERICWHVFIRSLRNNNANLKANKSMRPRPESARSGCGAFSVHGPRLPQARANPSLQRGSCSAGTTYRSSPTADKTQTLVTPRRLEPRRRSVHPLPSIPSPSQRTARAAHLAPTSTPRRPLYLA